ncbi:transposable element Tc1 transposase [Trichonephila clavipes]|nr:transposable element Tc1 transposase [Trichonephila clavipes]
MNSDFSFITPCPLGEQLLLTYTAGHIWAGGYGIILWRTFSCAGSRILNCGRTAHEIYDYLNIIEDQLYPYNASVFPTESGIFQQGNDAPYYKARIMLKWLQEHNEES